MKRRGLVLAAGGAAALAAGVGWQQWRERAAPAAPGSRPGDAPSGSAARMPDAPGLPWTLRFAQPGGGELVMLKLLGRPLVLNFWATWCPPCIKEMPELDRFQRDFGGRGWQVVGLAVDNEPAVREFLQRQPVGYAIALAGFEGMGLGRQLGNDRGALPFTVAFDAAGVARQRRLGEASYIVLADWAKSI